MDKQQIMEIFEKLLTRYEDAERCVNGEFSCDIKSDEKILENELTDFRKRFYEALNN